MDKIEHKETKVDRSFAVSLTTQKWKTVREHVYVQVFAWSCLNHIEE
jgi:hypothetical protein